MIDYPISCLTVSPAGGGIVGTNLFAGHRTWFDGGVSLSTDNGTTWTAVDSGLVNSPVNALAVSPAGGGTGGTNLFAGTEMSGMFLSTNNGASWRGVNAGMTNSQVSCFVVSGTNLFAGTRGCGVFSSTNNGISWTAVNTGLTNTDAYALAVCGTSLFAGTGAGVFLSTNSGTTWTQANTPFSGFSEMVLVGENLFAGTWGGGVFVSTNNGTSWSAAGMTSFSISCLTVSGTNLFAGTDYGVFLSTNSGTSWTAVNQGLWASWGPTYSESITCFATVGQNLFAGTDDAGIFLSTNNGASWTAVNEGLPKHVMNHGVTGYLVDCLTSSGQNLFAGTDYAGIFLSTNNGTDWTPVNSGLASVGVTCLTLSGMNLFVGTWQDCVWRRPLSEMITAVEGSSEVPTTFALEQNYPNPFNAATVIKYTVQGVRDRGLGASDVKLAVYDVLGREVAALVNEQKPAGRYEFKFDGTGFASGVYVYRLTVGEDVATRKMALVR